MYPDNTESRMEALSLTDHYYDELGAAHRGYYLLRMSSDDHRFGE